jgi:hypothetical protein
MLALGALLVCGALLTLAALTTVFRRPDPPRWTRWSGELITLALVAAFALGIAYFIAGVSRAYEQGVSTVDLGLLAAVLAAAFVIARGLRLRTRPAHPVLTASEPSKPTPRAA